MKLINYMFTLILFCFSLSTYCFAQDTVRLTNGEWPPFMSENLKHFGVASHIVTEAFASEGIRTEYGFYPWKRSYMLAEKGKWDGSVVWSRSPERDEDFYFSDPVIISKEVFFFLKEKKFDWNNMEDLKNITVGASLGYFYGEDFKKAEEAGIIKVDRTTKDIHNLKKLLAGRIGVFVVNLYVGYDLLRKNFSDEERERITYHPKAVREASWHLILSKKEEKNRMLMEIFNRGLTKLKESGKKDKCLEDALSGKYEKK